MMQDTGIQTSFVPSRPSTRWSADVKVPFDLFPILRQAAVVVATSMGEEANTTCKVASRGGQVAHYKLITYENSSHPRPIRSEMAFSYAYIPTIAGSLLCPAGQSGGKHPTRLPTSTKPVYYKLIS